MTPMNESPDNLDTSLLHDPNASNGAIDPLLAAELDAHFAAQRTPPPDAEAFWQRLVPHLEPHEAPADSSAPVSGKTVQPDPDRSRRSVHSDRYVSARRPPASRLRRGISSGAAVAAVLLISLAAFMLFHQLGLVASNGQTIKRGHLNWHLVTMPPGVVLDVNGTGLTEYQPGQPTTTATPAAAQPNASLAVASANGDVAYICQIPTNGSVLLWRTTDAGRSWSRLPDLPDTAVTTCAVQTDANDALTVLVRLGHGIQGTAQVVTIALFDGATQWDTLGFPTVVSFSSSDGVYYAISDAPEAFGQPPQAHLFRSYRSAGNMQSWYEIDAPLTAENLATARRLKLNGVTGVEHIWLQPQTGELLAQTYDGVLWRTTTNGVTWTQLKLPPLPPAAELTPTPGEMISETGEPPAAIVYVQQPVADHPFTLCALVLDQQLTIFNVAPLYCSTDSGQTWTRRPRPAVPQGNGKPDQFQMPSAMLPDGSLFSWDVTTIYRMPGNDAIAPAGFVVGTIPPPHDPNDIPNGLYGVTARGVTLWQSLDPQTLYVAQYTISPVSSTP